MKLKDICCACLSIERKLSPLNCLDDGANNLFSLLTRDSDVYQAIPDMHIKHLYICWECDAVLRRLCCFRQQVLAARRQLEDIFNETLDIDTNKECLSKLSYYYKQSFDKELVYTDVLNTEQVTDDEDDMKNDEIISYCDVKTEHDVNKEGNDTFSDLNCADNEKTIKNENRNSKNMCIMKRGDRIKSGRGENGFLNGEITDVEIPGSKMKRRILKRKVNDTAKRISAKAVKNNTKIVKQLEENKKSNVQIQKASQAAPKPRRPRKVQNKPKEEPNYLCTECGQIFTTYTRRYEHVMKYHKEGYQCSTCGKRFYIKKSFLRHERVHIAKTLPRERCTICDAMVRCDLVQDHALRHASKDRGTYECAPCHKKFANKNSYRKHMTEAKAHLAPDTEKKYECETCHKSFPTLMLYNCHMRYTKRHAVRAAVYRYKCSMCEKSYRNPAALRDHVNYVHMGKTQHKCTECDKALASPQCVARHMKLFHGGYKYPKNKLCDTCGKAFSSKKDLREHESVHTGERPLKCDVCGDTFRQSGALYTHKRRVHKVPLKPSVELVTEPDETVERLVMNSELDEADLVINRVIKEKKD